MPCSGWVSSYVATQACVTASSMLTLGLYLIQAKPSPEASALGRHPCRSRLDDKKGTISPWEGRFAGELRNWKRWPLGKRDEGAEHGDGSLLQSLRPSHGRCIFRNNSSYSSSSASIHVIPRSPTTSLVPHNASSESLRHNA